MKKKPIFLAVFFLFFSNFCFADTTASVIPLPRSIEKKGFEVKIDNSWTIDLVSKDQEDAFAADYFSGKIKKLYNVNLGLNYGKRNINKKGSIIVTDNLPDVTYEEKNEMKSKIGDEGYYLDVDNDSVIVYANSPRGIFYAFITLSQLVKEKDGFLILPAVRIIDYPGTKMRVAHIIGVRFDEAKEMLDVMVSLKFNTVIMESRDYFHLDENNNREKLEQVFDYARKLHITPIPELQSFGYAGWQLEIDPNAAEGIWVKDSHFKFIKDRAIPLKPMDSPLVNVIRSSDSNIVIASLDKTKSYEEGLDYKIIGGKIFYPYQDTEPPLEIRRIPDGGIREDEEVLVSYDYVTGKFTNGTRIPYCPSSERTYKIMENAMAAVVYSAKPDYISIGHDEIMGLNRDSRCRKRNLTNSELLAEDINRLYDIIRGLDPDIKLFIWDDMFNPLHNARERFQMQFGGIRGETSSALDLIPQDTIFMIWWYDEKEPFNKLTDSSSYFSEKGFKYLITGWKNKDAISKWSKVTAQDENCLGIIATAWSGWKSDLENIKSIANISWSY